MSIIISGLSKCFFEDEDKSISYIQNMPRKLRRLSGELAKLFYATAYQAMEDANIDDKASVPIITATSLAEINHSLELMHQTHSSKGQFISPTLVQNTVANSSAGILSIAFSNHNPSVTFSGNFLSLYNAFSFSLTLLKMNTFDKILIVGGEPEIPLWKELVSIDTPLLEDYQAGVVAFVLSRDETNNTGKNYGKIVNSCVFSLQEEESLTRETLDKYDIQIDDETNIIISEIAQKRFSDVDKVAKNLSVDKERIQYNVNELISPYKEMYEIVVEKKNLNTILLKTEHKNISIIKLENM